MRLGYCVWLEHVEEPRAVVLKDKNSIAHLFYSASHRPGVQNSS